MSPASVHPAVTAPGAAPTVHAAGPPEAVGRALGEAGRIAVHAHLVPSAPWARAQAFVGSDRLAALEAATRHHAPAVWAEITGLATGLGLPHAAVFAWVCRGDLPGVLWPAGPTAGPGAEGCTTVAWRDGAGGGLLAHNEDGDPALAGAVFLARVTPETGPAFTAFCYPGSPPGHAFSWTDAGLVQTINNLRLVRPALGLPRLVRARAVLSAPSLAAARQRLEETGPGAGGFHHLLACPGEGLLGLEVTPAGCIADPGDRPTLVHANHVLWTAPGATQPVAQVVTASSAARQRRAEALVAGWPACPDVGDLMAVLDDEADSALPIRRTDPSDPDGEVTLGRLTARIGPESLICTAHLFKPR